MKKHLLIFLILTIVSSLTLIEACKKSENKPNDDNGGDDLIAYVEGITVLQENANASFQSFLVNQDTSEAMVSLATWFETNPTVSWADTNSQGVIVQYKNGIRGGFFLNGEDEDDIVPPFSSLYPIEKQQDEYLKSTPNKKKMIFLNPHYAERIGWFNYIISSYSDKYGRVFESYDTYKDSQCTVDQFTKLSPYGYIHIYSHGFAWPHKWAISEVYLMTCESVNENTTTKYIEDLKNGKIIILFDRFRNKNLYYLAPSFIRQSNNFSQDTVLFYGGFCYSFQGNWPNIVNDFADGAYFGHTWRVFTSNNATWARSIFEYMSDTNKMSPITTDKWMTGTPELPKEYFDNRDKVTVKLHYTGNGALTLWKKKKTTIEIIPQESDGAPITVAGEVNQEYVFTCKVDGEFSDINWLKFRWDFGDGSPVEEIESDNVISHSWPGSGSFPLKVELIYLGGSQPFIEKTVYVTINPPDNYLENYAAQKTISSNHYSLSIAYIVTCETKTFTIRDDTLVNIYDPPEFNYRHSLNLWDKNNYQPGEIRTYHITFSLSELTSDLPGTLSYKKVWIQYWDRNGSTYQEYDGLSPIIMTLQTDDLNNGSFTSDAWIIRNEGGNEKETHLFPLDGTIMKEN